MGKKEMGTRSELVTPVSCLFIIIVGSKNILRQQPMNYEAVSSIKIPEQERRWILASKQVETTAVSTT